VVGIGSSQKAGP